MAIVLLPYVCKPLLLRTLRAGVLQFTEWVSNVSIQFIRSVGVIFSVLVRACLILMFAALTLSSNGISCSNIGRKSSGIRRGFFDTLSDTPPPPPIYIYIGLDRFQFFLNPLRKPPTSARLLGLWRVYWCKMHFPCEIQSLTAMTELNATYRSVDL